MNSTAFIRNSHRKLYEKPSRPQLLRCISSSLLLSFFSIFFPRSVRPTPRTRHELAGDFSMRWDRGSSHRRNRSLRQKFALCRQCSVASSVPFHIASSHISHMGIIRTNCLSIHPSERSYDEMIALEKQRYDVSRNPVSLRPKRETKQPNRDTIIWELFFEPLRA